MLGSWDGADVGAQNGTSRKELQGYRRKTGEREVKEQN